MPQDDPLARSVDPHARLDAADGVLWEPVWRLATRPSPLERALLRTPALRRLHFVVHGGACSFATPYVHSRLQHVLGVFALAASLVPHDAEVRAAALLHDVGHAPFSHSLEGVPGVDHHRWTAEIVRREPIAGLLRREGLDPERILSVAEGEVATVLKNRDGVLHLDHLDSLVRSGRMRGTLPVPPARIAARATREGPYAAFDAETGGILEDLIVEEARLHADPIDLGTSAALSELAARLVEAGALRVDDLPRMMDAELAARLFDHPATGADARRLWLEPWRHRAERLAPGAEAPAGARIATKDRLYLDLPRVRGRSAAEATARREGMRKTAERWLGRYLLRVDAGEAPAA